MVGRPYRSGTKYYVDGAWLKKTETQIGQLQREIKQLASRRKTGLYQPSHVSLENATGDYRDRGKVVKVEVKYNKDDGGGFPFNPHEYFVYSVYTAKPPTGKKEDVHAILVTPLEEVRDGAAVLARGILHGSCPALVDIQSSDHRYAEIVEDEYVLRSTSTETAIKIMEEDLPVGIRHARVMIGGGAGAPAAIEIGATLVAIPRNWVALVIIIRDGKYHNLTPEEPEPTWDLKWAAYDHLGFEGIPRNIEIILGHFPDDPLLDFTIREDPNDPNSAILYSPQTTWRIMDAGCTHGTTHPLSYGQAPSIDPTDARFQIPKLPSNPLDPDLDLD